MRRGSAGGIRHLQGDERSIHISNSVYGGPLQRRRQRHGLSRTARLRTGTREEDTCAAAAEGMGADRRRWVTGPKLIRITSEETAQLHDVHCRNSEASPSFPEPDIAPLKRPAHPQGAAKRPQFPQVEAFLF